MTHCDFGLLKTGAIIIQMCKRNMNNKRLNNGIIKMTRH